jgi:F-type H+-transporting ATPase subunit delta
MKINKQAKRKAKRLLRDCLTNGALDEDRARIVARRIASAGERDCLAVLSYFRHLLKLEYARRRAVVESAVPVPADLQADIEADLRRRYGPGLSTTFVHRPELIGGLRIQVGSDLYDGSVRAGLAALEKNF